MEIITSEDFHHICFQKDSTLLKTTYDRPKLLETPAGEMVKIFYPRRKRFSSNSFKPYAIRFKANANRLRQLGFAAPHVENIKFCPDLRTYILIYQKIPGENARILANQNMDIIAAVAKYLVELHHQGIFFRSLHLENLLYQETEEFLLLDIVDVKFKKNPLNIFFRYRNLKHMFFIEDDATFWQSYGIEKFVEQYLKLAKLSRLSTYILKRMLKQK